MDWDAWWGNDDLDDLNSDEIEVINNGPTRILGIEHQTPGATRSGKARKGQSQARTEAEITEE